MIHSSYISTDFISTHFSFVSLCLLFLLTEQEKETMEKLRELKAKKAALGGVEGGRIGAVTGSGGGTSAASTGKSSGGILPFGKTRMEAKKLAREGLVSYLLERSKANTSVPSSDALLAAGADAGGLDGSNAPATVETEKNVSTSMDVQSRVDNGLETLKAKDREARKKIKTKLNLAIKRQIQREKVGTHCCRGRNGNENMHRGNIATLHICIRVCPPFFGIFIPSCTHPLQNTHTI